MSIYDLDLKIAAARHIRWLLDSVTLSAEGVTVEGWALSLWDDQEDCRFTINGQDVDHLEWPLPSPYLHDHFSGLPRVDTSAFRWHHRKRPGEDLFPGGFARFDLTSRFGEHRRTYRTAWFVADPAIEPPMPSSGQIARVIGTGDLPVFQWGGATIVNRFDHYLRDRFDRPLSSFSAVLDWGCGAGRLSRYLPFFVPSFTGIDIDADNIKNCRETIPRGTFVETGLYPPTPFPDDRFDLIIGLSIFTHMDEATQTVWLAELRRLARPGAILLLSVQGFAQSALYRVPEELLKKTHRQGLYCRGLNDQLHGQIGDDTYYKDTIHSLDYIYARWGQYFDVLDDVAAIAGNQDLIVLRAK